MSAQENAPGRGQPTTGRNYERRDDTGLPSFLQELLASPPQHGGGVHKWLYTVSRHLHAHRSEQAIVDILTAAVRGCGRGVPNREIVEAVEDSKSSAWQPNGNRYSRKGKRQAFKPAARKSKWPTVNEEMRQQVITSINFTLSDLIAASPVLSHNTQDAEQIVDILFPGNPLLYVGKSQEFFTTASREELRGLFSTIPFMVPSPMIATEGRRKKDGKLSMHTLDNTGPRRYLVTEFDPPKWDSLSGDKQAKYGTEENYFETSRDDQAALIWHLRQYAPLVLVLWSGSKSFHAWWDCSVLSVSTQEKLMRYAVSLGADPATWTRSQFVRIPQGWREEKQQRQEVYYFDPTSGKANAQ